MKAYRNGPRHGSVVDQISKLSPGEAFTVSAPMGAADEAFPQWAETAKRRLMNAISPKVTLVRQWHPERVYSAESGLMVSSANRAHAVLVVTRLADVDTAALAEARAS